jgi:hypothetical protein
MSSALTTVQPAAGRLDGVKNAGKAAVAWMGNHKIETAGYAIAGTLAVAAVAASILTGGTLPLILGCSLGGGALVVGAGTGAYHFVHHKKDIAAAKAQDALDDAATKKAAKDAKDAADLAAAQQKEAAAQAHRRNQWIGGVATVLGLGAACGLGAYLLRGRSAPISLSPVGRNCTAAERMDGTISAWAEGFGPRNATCIVG